MCVVSMVLDRFGDKWTQPPYQPATPYVPMTPPPKIWPTLPPAPPMEPVKPLNQEEIDELRDWLQRAKEYDKRTGQPDCESDAKIERLKKIILELAPETDLSFLDEDK